VQVVFDTPAPAKVMCFTRFFRGFPLRVFFRMTIPKVLFKRGAYDFYGEINVL